LQAKQELKLRYSQFELECGTDEAGRGCLAGPVVAAAVILPEDFNNATLNDSKQLSETMRDALRLEIEAQAIAWHVAYIDERVIEQTNILQASISAMHKAIEGLAVAPEFILVDGNKFRPYNRIPHRTMIKGDAKYLNIAAASILAKTHRDAYMKQLHKQYPVYHWHKNKGYPTKAHREAIVAHGTSPYHRKSFKLLAEQYRLQL